MNDRDMERKKEALIVLPPVQATANPDHQSRVKAIAPLSKWKIERCSTLQPEYCQKELVDYWLYRNNIHVVERLPKIDPAILTNRGTDVSKYFSFIFPVKFGLKVFSRENTQKKALMPPLRYSSRCPRLLRSQQRSEMEMFPRNPVVRVGGGYRRLSWKVLDILPSIGAYDPEFPPAYSCTSCHASLPVIEKVTNSRGQLRTILAAPKRCLNCGTPTTDYQAVKDGDLHESVRDTLHKGDSRFIVDHRKFEHSQIPSSNTKKSERELSSSPIDWRDDIESFRLHMSRQSQHDDGLETRDQSPDQKRSESGRSVFITESEPSNDDVNKPQARRCAWDDGSSKADETNEDRHQSGGSVNGQGTGSYCSDNDHFSEFEIIEDYDPKSGFSVKLRRKPFGESQKTNYFIHGIETEEATGQNPKASRRKIAKHRGDGVVRRKDSSSPRHRSDRKFSPGKNQNTPYSPERNGKEVFKNGQLKEKVISRQTKSTKYPLNRSESSYTVGLDRRDYLFVDEPVLIESDDDDDIFNPKTRLIEEEFSNVELWSPDPLSPRAARGTPTSPSTNQPDGYIADNEENVDLSSLQAQIQKVRDQTKRHQKRKEEEIEESENKIEEQNEITKEFDSQEKTPEKDSAQKEDPLRNTQWDSDWDSDFSLHIQPLSDLSASSSENEQWESGIHRNVNNADTAEQQMGKSSEKTNKDSLTTKEAARREEVPRRVLNAGAHDQVTEGRNNKEANRDERKQRRKIVVKPIPSLGLGSDSEDIAPRPRPRPVRDEGELSDSDLNFFKQQLQAPRRKKSQGNNQTSDDPVGCKGIDCYRCGAKIPECEGVCSKCGTWCQRPGGPCDACRDVCDRCGKPKYRCLSVDEESEKSEKGEEEFEDLSDSQESHHKPTPPLTNEHLQERGESLIEENGKPHEDGIAETKKERKIRAPHERKKKDLTKVKRVRARRENTILTEEGEQELENSIVNDPTDKMDESVMNQESIEEDQPMESPILGPSAVLLKSTRRSKPSKQVISQTVVYKEKHKPPKAEVTPPQEEDTYKEESFDTSPMQGTEAGVPGEEFVLDGGEATGSEIPEDDKNLAEETKIEEKNINENEKVDYAREEKAVKEKEVQIKVESEEPQIQVEIKKKIIPKIRGVARVNAAFKERVELAKRLQTVLREAISNVIGQADIKVRKDSSIDFLAQYRLVDRSHLEMYGRAFTLEDEDEDGIISYEQMLVAFEGVTSITGMSRKQLMFVVKVLELHPGSRITFKMFSVTTALCEKVSVLDEFVKRLVEDLDLFELECKLDFYRKMFFVTGDYSANYITADQLRIELKAGGLNQSQEDHVIGHIMQSTYTGEISFLDYMAYLPLFLSMHKNICDNALDMSRNKYQRSHAT